MIKNEPLLSICIPTYNREKCLKKLLDSIVCQKEFIDTDDVEIIVDDGPSSDSTESLIKEYIKKFWDKIKYYRNPIRIWMCPAFLEALSLWTGKYLWLMSSDEFILEDYLSYLLNICWSNNDLIITSIFNWSGDVNKSFNDIWNFLWYFGNLNIPYAKKDYFFSHLTSCCIKKSYYNESYNYLIDNGKVSEQILKENYFNFNLINIWFLFPWKKIVLIEKESIDCKYNSGDVSSWNINIKIVFDMVILCRYLIKNYNLPLSAKKLLRHIQISWFMLWLISPIRNLLTKFWLINIYNKMANWFRRIFNI